MGDNLFWASINSLVGAAAVIAAACIGRERKRKRQLDTLRWHVETHRLITRKTPHADALNNYIHDDMERLLTLLQLPQYDFSFMIIAAISYVAISGMPLLLRYSLMPYGEWWVFLISVGMVCCGTALVAVVEFVRYMRA